MVPAKRLVRADSFTSNINITDGEVNSRKVVKGYLLVMHKNNTVSGANLKNANVILEIQGRSVANVTFADLFYLNDKFYKNIDDLSRLFPDITQNLPSNLALPNKTEQTLHFFLPLIPAVTKLLDEVGFTKIYPVRIRIQSNFFDQVSVFALEFIHTNTKQTPAYFPAVISQSGVGEDINITLKNNANAIFRTADYGKPSARIDIYQEGELVYYNYVGSSNGVQPYWGAKDISDTKRSITVTFEQSSEDIVVVYMSRVGEVPPPPWRNWDIRQKAKDIR